MKPVRALSGLGIGLCLAAFVLAGSAARAQSVSDVMNFFSNELDMSSGKDNAQDAAKEAKPQSKPQSASIDEIFGGSPLGAAENSATGTQTEARKYDPKLVEKELRNEAFAKALQGMLPLNPEQIRRVLEEFDRAQESSELPVYPLPKPEFTVQTLSLDPGTKPLTVRVAQGHVTTLNFLDVTGAPWPIEDVTWAGNFNIMQSGDSGDGVHFVRITPQSGFAYGNMSIKMLGLKTPLIMTLETSRDLVHYRFDAIIPDYGPLAEAPLIEGGVSLAAGGNPAMSSVLQGVIPSGAQRMAVRGVDSRTSAYSLGNKVYVRTPLTLLSPSWTSSVASADGMRVYTIKNAPVLLLSDNGKMLRANLSKQEEVEN